ncbi:hypothetical protein E1B28_000586 [Marasmius oreades]|uniref:Mei2-like C-terminal RNA recognition motif domain-containing protein n=1 Tax=Marasmius oreades TaxID=181124 RepID=A0A9P7V1T8_9AGAR|nr:uncharacterized protein E1B28_000586 [Marasmius oreades]KAG7098672.1 hypothetical protein E1B28_000586 [Marasmius oreades]
MRRCPSLPNIWLPPSSDPRRPAKMEVPLSSLLIPPLTRSPSPGPSWVDDVDATPVIPVPCEDEASSAIIYTAGPAVSPPPTPMFAPLGLRGLPMTAAIPPQAFGPPPFNPYCFPPQPQFEPPVFISNVNGWYDFLPVFAPGPCPFVPVPGPPYIFSDNTWYAAGVAPSPCSFSPPRTPSTCPSSSSSLLGPGPGPAGNVFSLSRLQDREDLRTTVMLKNIPNKLTSDGLVTFIQGVVGRKIDFIYLRMDFTEKCNFGYAFVNFMTVESLLTFARAKLGRKWNLCKSQKVLDMCYADIQGKASMVEKFRNSSIMKEQPPDWQPRIFFSEPGPMQGLPEPFPPPTLSNKRRREVARRVESTRR